MTEAYRIPRFDEDLADFVAELRSRVFSSKLEAARYFNLARPTVSRYESGQITPPFGYLVNLAQLLVSRLQREGQPFEDYQRNLLREINTALRWHYREKEPFHKPFQSWQELDEVAQGYLDERHKATPGSSSSASASTRQEDWGEAVDLPAFYGREAELAVLENWLVNDHCRLVALLGLGGIGKTTLSIKLVEQVKDKYDFLIWRSLRNAPLVETILGDCIKFLSGQQELHLPEGLDNQISLLIEYLRKTRCLLVLDNLETILHAGEHESVYREGYQGYAELISRIGNSAHQSCLLLTSREKPGEVALLEGKNSPVQSLLMRGLAPASGQKILEDKALFGPEAAFSELITLYSGNPLALKLVSATIFELFGGDIQGFLSEGQLIFGGLGKLLDQQFGRLSLLEQAIMYWLALGREPVSLATLQADLLPPVPKKDLLEALKSLRGRSIIERAEASDTGLPGPAFTQQPVVMEYMTEQLITRVSTQIKVANLEFLTRYAFTKAQDKDYVQQSQVNVIIQPILNLLLTTFKTRENLEIHLTQLLSSLKELPRTEQGYGGGNLVALLYHLRGDLRGLDFSGLNIWQAYLQGVDLQDASFAGSDLAGSVFTETFDAIGSVAFNLDGTLLAAGSSNGELRLWRVQDGKSLLRCEGHAAPIQAVVFSPDSSIMASASHDRTVKVWNVATGQCLKTLRGHQEWVWSVAISPDGTRLASCGRDRMVKLWEIESGECLQTLHGHTNSVRGVAFSPDGRFLASGGGDRVVKLWEVASGACFKTLHGHAGWVQSVAFSPDSKMLLSGGEDSTLRLWEVSTGQLLQTFEGHHQWIWSVAFSPDGESIASAGDERIIRLWQVNNGQCLKVLQGHDGPVGSVSFSPDGLILASGSGDRTIKLWELQSGKCFKTLQGYSNPTRAIAFSPNGKTLAISGNRSVSLWEVASSHLLRTLHNFNELIWSIAFSPDGKLIAGGSDEHTIRLWEAESGQFIKVMQGHSEWVQGVAFSPTEFIVASGSGDHTIKLWDARPTGNGECLRTLHGHTEWVWSVAFSPDGQKLLSGSQDGTLRLWDVQSGDCLMVVQNPAGGILSVAYSPDGSIFASGGNAEDLSVRLWDARNGEPRGALVGHSRMLWALNFSPVNARLLASGGEDGTVRLWDTESGGCLRILEGHQTWVRSVVFSPDGRLVASGSIDGTTRLWDTESGECLHILRNDRPYERLNISGVMGLTEPQRASLKNLGAIENR